MEFQIPPLAHRLRNQEKIRVLEEELLEIKQQQKRMLEHITELTDIVMNLESTDE